MRIFKDHTERNREFEKLVVLKQKEMKEFLKEKLREHMDSNGREDRIISDDGYLFYRGTFPVLLCAHMDTLHMLVPSTIVYANGTISSPQGIGGDDRCGIYMILKILKQYDCSVLFLEDEESGCVGAKKFARTELCRNLERDDCYKFIIELDRKGNNHAVFYDCDNYAFERFITKEFFVEKTGTCSDISYIAPSLGVAAVNLSCGYYDEHHLYHYVHLDEMEKVIEETLKILERSKDKEKFKYVKKTSYSGYGYGSTNYYGRYYDDWDYSWSNYKPKKKYMFRFIREENGKKYIKEVYINGNSIEECFYKFFREYTDVCYENILASGWYE